MIPPVSPQRAKGPQFGGTLIVRGNPHPSDLIELQQNAPNGLDWNSYSTSTFYTPQEDYVVLSTNYHNDRDTEAYLKEWANNWGFDSVFLNETLDADSYAAQKAVERFHDTVYWEAYSPN